MQNKLKLYPHQERALEWIAGNPNKKVLLALDMGLGKSAIASCTIKEGERVLVICPASLKLNWVKELKTWAIESKIKVVKKKNETLPGGPGIIIMSYDLLGKKVKKRAVANYDFSDFDRVIVDESHSIKNSKSTRSKITAKIIKHTKNAILLSGTPMERAMDLFVPLYALGAITMNMNSYGFKFCDAKQVHLGMRTVWSFRGLTNEEELLDIIEPYTIKMKKEDVIDLPERHIEVISLDLPVGRQEKKYSFEDIIKDPRPIGFEGLSELLHEQGLRKVPLAIQHIKMRLEQNEKIFVTAKHTDVIDILEEKLAEFNPVIIDGRKTTKQKEEVKAIFQTDKNCRICIGQTVAAGTGHTLTAANHVILVEPDWSHSAIMQLVDRCHRIGQKKNVTAELLTIHGSIDERVLYTTLEKKSYKQALGL